MSEKLLLILSRHEQMALIRLAAELGVSPLYAARVALVEYLSEKHYIDEVVKNALLIKFILRSETNYKILEYLKRTRYDYGYDEAHQRTSLNPRREIQFGEDLFGAACQALFDRCLNPDEIEHWKRLASRFSFLENAKNFLRLAEELGNYIKAPKEQLMRDEVLGDGRGEGLPQNTCGGRQGSSNGLGRGDLATVAGQGDDDHRVIIELRPLPPTRSSRSGKRPRETRGGDDRDI